MNDSTIETQRLRLVLLNRDALEALRIGDVDGASRLQGFVFSDDFLGTVNDAFLTRQIEGLTRSPMPGWFARAILRKDDGVVIGHCGFHGAPQDVGRAEVGYTIFPPFRRQGYAVESVQGLVDWAGTQGSSSVFASVLSDNHASLGVVRKLGFLQSGVQTNRDGLQERVFECTSLSGTSSTSS